MKNKILFVLMCVGIAPLALMTASMFILTIWFMIVNNGFPSEPPMLFVYMPRVWGIILLGIFIAGVAHHFWSWGEL